MHSGSCERKRRVLRKARSKGNFLSLNNPGGALALADGNSLKKTQEFPFFPSPFARSTSSSPFPFFDVRPIVAAVVCFHPVDVEVSFEAVEEEEEEPL